MFRTNRTNSLRNVLDEYYMSFVVKSPCALFYDEALYSANVCDGGMPSRNLAELIIAFYKLNL